ncbi:MAG: MBL fold metallo-hydrolase [Bacteroidia bacterium]|nr:MBL fold metallo-hydrolase [Bacteroidia bacterium]
MQLFTVHAGFFKLDGGAMFGVVPKSIWNKINPADENNMCSWAMRCLLVQDGNRNILIDNGIGNKQDEKFFSYYYLHGNETLDGSLKKIGLSRNDITDVVLTHLHFDHCGGSIEKTNDGKFVPAFPNARYWSNEEHWNWAVNPNAREKASFLKENIIPIQESGQLNFLKKGENLTEHLSFEWVYGHTEAMMLPKLKYKGKTLLFMADLVPSSGHVPLPYVMAYDMRPLQTLSEKEKILSQLADEEGILFFEHDPQTECATIERTEKGFRVKDKFMLSEL